MLLILSFQIVMRNMRQFMSGMKNYLVKHGEKGFDKEVERERNKVSLLVFLPVYYNHTYCTICFQSCGLQSF